MIPKLKIISGEGLNGPIELAGESITFGRESGNTVELRNGSVSRRHCIIERRGDEFIVSDLGSLNGTFVNGAAANGTHLVHGDEIQIGDFAFRFVDGSEAPRSSSVAIDRTEFRLPKNSLQVRIDEVFGGMARDLTAIIKIANKVNSIRSQSELFRQLIGSIFETVPADEATIVLVDGDGAINESFSLNRREFPEPVTVNELLIDAALRNGEAIIVPESDTGDSIIVVPMHLFDSPFGAIWLSAGNSRLDDTHLRFLSAVAGIAAVAIANTRAWNALEEENRRLRESAFDRNMIGESEKIQAVLAVVRKVAPSDATVLIDGESGTGKELAAQSIHLNSKRRERPFVAINCAALTETLLESELFGHEKGAFTGAVAQKKGKIELAGGGTLFLDEIGEMNAALQAKLLRVLQEREFERVGGTRSQKADIRLVAATNRDLAKEVAEGRFRQDLFYRLNVVRITMPALRDRREDIPVLTEFFLRRFASRAGRRVRGVTATAMKLLKTHDFPGNVRELENICERAVVLGSDEWIRPEDLPDEIIDGGTSHLAAATTFHGAVRDTKRKLIIDAVRASGGSFVEAARILDLHPNYLHRLIRNLELKDEI